MSPFMLRLAIQFEVRRLKRNSRGATFAFIQDMRVELEPLLAKLKVLQEAAGVYPSGNAPAGHTQTSGAARSAAGSAATATHPPPTGTATQPLPPGTADPNAADSSGGVGAGTVRQAVPSGPADEALAYWDSFNDIAADDDGAAHTHRQLESLSGGGQDTPPEHARLVLPSNGNTNMDFEMPEIAIRKKTADSLLSQIREVIAQKSFRYTEHMRAAPRKGVRTRARTTIDDLHRKLSLLCQVYAYCRERLIDLRVDREVLSAFRVLTQEDVRCSTAVLSPNLPGSTKLTLSWIWQSIDRRFEAGDTDNIDTSDPVTLLECKSA